jgi:hypothetical protein
MRQQRLKKKSQVCSQDTHKEFPNIHAIMFHLLVLSECDNCSDPAGVSMRSVPAAIATNA